MPGFLGHTAIRREELQRLEGRNVQPKLAKILKGRTLIECHGINHDIVVGRANRGLFIATVLIEHRDHGDDSGPRYAASYKITRAKDGSYNVQLVKTEGADVAGSEILAMQKAFFESEGRA